MKLDHFELPDCYRVIPGFYYYADGKKIHCEIDGTVAELKQILGATRITQVPGLNRSRYAVDEHNELNELNEFSEFD